MLSRERRFSNLRQAAFPSFAILVLLFLCAAPVHPQTQETIPQEKRLQYQIKIKLDFENRAYSGSERVRWINRGDHPTAVLYFHLYSNLRSESGKTAPATSTAASRGQQSDEPHIEVTRVSAAVTGAALPYSLDDQGTSLRITLREMVAPGNAAEININFKGTVPEIDPEETGLVTHIVQQVSAALRSDRELRRARDVNFRCRNVMMLGTAYPVLAAREGDDWLRKVEPSVGDIVLADVADYQVEIEAPPAIALFTSGDFTAPVSSGAPNQKISRAFVGENLRDFAIIAGPTLRAEERAVGNVTVRSVFMPEHEGVARRVLNVAAESLRVYAARFGPLPLKNFTIVGTPLVAGFGSAEFSGLGAIASAFYVDFDSATMRNMPEVIREQRESLEESLEWSVAHMVAHQWWGAVVGNDPAREPVLDEGLANWSALLYYREVHGEKLASGAMDEQLRGVYKVYRTFGGEDLEANRAARDFRNSFQYSAIVSSKGALMFVALQRLLGDEKCFAALRSYYAANSFEIADMDDLRGAFIAEAPLAQRRVVARTFGRWLASKRGDEDIAPPDAQLAAELGLPVKTNQKGGDRSPLTAFSRVGKFFWQQMTRIR